jgi:hypothetical protein
MEQKLKEDTLYPTIFLEEIHNVLLISWLLFLVRFALDTEPGIFPGGRSGRTETFRASGPLSVPGAFSILEMMTVTGNRLFPFSA